MNLHRVEKGVFVWLVSSAAVGCGDGSEAIRGPLPLERDSAGVHIVENSWHDAGEGISYRVNGPPSVRIGQVEGEPAYLFSRVGPLLLLPDGRILVVDARTELRFFSSRGEHLLTVGGRGPGPGEFRSISGIVLARDTLFVFDQLASRVSYFGSQGEFLGDVRLPAELFLWLDSTPELIAAPPDGRFVFRPAGFSVPRRDPVELFWSTSPLVSVMRDGQTADTLTVIGMDWITGNQQVLVPPFGRWTSVISGGDRLVMTHGNRYELEVRSVETGDLRRVIRLRRDPVRLTSSEWRASLKEALEREAQAQLPRAGPEALAEMGNRLEPLTEIPIPYATRPAWTGLFLDAGGRIWAEESSPADDSLRVFSVFSADGHLIGRATTPNDVRIAQVGLDYVLAVRRDEMDIEYVELLPIRSG